MRCATALLACALAGASGWACFETTVGALPGAECDLAYETYVGDTLEAVAYQDDAVYVEFYDAVSGAEAWETVLHLELVGGVAGEVTDLAGQFQYATCERCVLLATDCTAFDEDSCGRWFIATSGTLEVTAIDEDQPWSAPVEFTATHLVLEECEITWANYHSTLVHNGDRICIDTWHVEATPIPG